MNSGDLQIVSLDESLLKITSTYFTDCIYFMRYFQDDPTGQGPWVLLTTSPQYTEDVNQYLSLQCLADFLPDFYTQFTPKTNKAFLLYGEPVVW